MRSVRTNFQTEETLVCPPVEAHRRQTAAVSGVTRDLWKQRRWRHDVPQWALFFVCVYPRCEVCGFQCRQRASLKYHMTKHKAEADLEFACVICQKRFEKAHNLNVHMSMIHPLTQDKSGVTKPQQQPLPPASQQQQPFYDLNTVTQQEQDRWQEEVLLCCTAAETLRLTTGLSSFSEWMNFLNRGHREPFVINPSFDFYFFFS